MIGTPDIGGSRAHGLDGCGDAGRRLTMSVRSSATPAPWLHVPDGRQPGTFSSSMAVVQASNIIEQACARAAGLEIVGTP